VAQPGMVDRSVPGLARKSEDGLDYQAKTIVRETSLRTLHPYRMDVRDF